MTTSEILATTPLTQGHGQLTVANATIPEPSAFVLLGLGAVGLVARHRRSA